MLNGPWCTLSAISLSFVRTNSDDCNEYFVWRIFKTKNRGTLRNFFWPSLNSHARAFSSLSRSPAGLKIQYRRTCDSLCSLQFCNYFETFQCMLIFWDFSMHVAVLRSKLQRDHRRLDKLDHVSEEMETFWFWLHVVELNPAGSPAVNPSVGSPPKIRW